MMPGSKASWVPVPAQPYDQFFEAYPNESLAEWHLRHGLVKPES